jgi:hypothetical protein
MRKDQIAEKFLGLLTTPERAAAISGDLMESAARRGGFWFWSRVLRTAAALLWSGFMAEPFHLLKLGFTGSFLAIVVSNLAQACVVTVTIGVVGIAHTAFAYGQPLDWGRIFQNGMIRWGYYALLFGLPLVCMFWVGRWVARRVPGREVIGGAVLIVGQCVLSTLGAVLVSVLDAHGIKPPSGDWHSPADVVTLTVTGNAGGLVANMAGAIWMRRRTARQI